MCGKFGSFIIFVYVARLSVSACPTLIPQTFRCKISPPKKKMFDRGRMRGGKRPRGAPTRSWLKWQIRTPHLRDEVTSSGQMQEAEMQMMQGGSGVTFGQEEEVLRVEQEQGQGGDLRSVLNKRR